MSRPARAAALVLVAAFAAVNLGNALHKGGDFDLFLEAGRHVIDGRPLYEGSSPGSGVIGPPFQGIFFAPFAAIGRLSDPAAAILWYILNLAALAGGVLCWARALDSARPSPAALWATPAVLFSLAAIVVPAQTNFEHQNMNSLLLGLTGAAALSLATGHERLSGGLLGLATALKAFPALLIAYLAVRGKRRTAMAAIMVALLLTMTPALSYGIEGALSTTSQWWTLASDEHWPTRVQNQSLVAMFLRIAPDAARWLSAAGAAALIAVLALVAMRRRTAGPSDIGRELALVLAAAVLISPIAWDHYWVLMFPAILAMHPSAHARRTAWLVFGVSAILISGLSPVTLGRHGFNVARAWCVCTVAGLLLVAGLTRTLIGPGRNSSVV
jgi:alpha-1,2-mannosyltransferase